MLEPSQQRVVAAVISMGWNISKGSVMGQHADNEHSGTQSGSANKGQQASQPNSQSQKQGMQAQNKNNNNSVEANKPGNRTSQQNDKGGGQHH